MKYMDIWAKPQPRPPKQQTNPGGLRLKGRVKDWPTEPRKAYQNVKDQLYKWAKKNNGRKDGLGLVAYEAVQKAYAPPEPQVPIINCETEEEVWNTILGLSRQ